MRVKVLKLSLIFAGLNSYPFESKMIVIEKMIILNKDSYDPKVKKSFMFNTLKT